MQGFRYWLTLAGVFWQPPTPHEARIDHRGVCWSELDEVARIVLRNPFGVHATLGVRAFSPVTGHSLLASDNQHQEEPLRFPQGYSYADQQRRWQQPVLASTLRDPTAIFVLMAAPESVQWTRIMGSRQALLLDAGFPRQNTAVRLRSTHDNTATEEYGPAFTLHGFVVDLDANARPGTTRIAGPFQTSLGHRFVFRFAFHADSYLPSTSSIMISDILPLPGPTTTTEPAQHALRCEIHQQQQLRHQQQARDPRLLGPRLYLHNMRSVYPAAQQAAPFQVRCYSVDSRVRFVLPADADAEESLSNVHMEFRPQPRQGAGPLQPDLRPAEYTLDPDTFDEPLEMPSLAVPETAPNAGAPQLSWLLESLPGDYTLRSAEPGDSGISVPQQTTAVLWEFFQTASESQVPTQGYRKLDLTECQYASTVRRLVDYVYQVKPTEELVSMRLVGYVPLLVDLLVASKTYLLEHLHQHVLQTFYQDLSMAHLPVAADGEELAAAYARLMPFPEARQALAYHALKPWLRQPPTRANLLQMLPLAILLLDITTAQQEVPVWEQRFAKLVVFQWQQRVTLAGDTDLDTLTSAYAQLVDREEGTYDALLHPLSDRLQ